MSDLITAKAQELKAAHKGRELLRYPETLMLLGISRTSGDALKKRGLFIREVNMGMRYRYYHVSDVAAYLLQGHVAQDAPLALLPAPATPKKIGRPKKQRSKRG